MLTGQLPFDLKLSATLLRHQLSSPTPPPSWLCDELDPNVEGIVLKAMRKNPANRYASALELRDDLERVQSGQAPRTALSTPESDVYTPQSARAEQAATLLGFSPTELVKRVAQAGSFASKNERSLTRFRWSRLKLGTT